MSLHTVNPTDDSTIPPTNRLLAALARDEYERLLPRLELVRFPKNRILYEAGEGIHYAYFPTHGMASCGPLYPVRSIAQFGYAGEGQEIAAKCPPLS